LRVLPVVLQTCAFVLVHLLSGRVVSLNDAHSDCRGERKIWVTGVLFLHRISDNKFSQTANRISTMLKSLCGDDAMKHLTLCTTMWDKVGDDEGFDRLDQLSNTGVLKEMISKGASVARISNVSPNAKAEAEKIVSQLIKNAGPVELAIQDEMVNQHKTALQTGAGQVLDEHLREVREQAERERKELSDRLIKEKEDIAAKAQAAIREKELEVVRLKTEEEKRTRELQAEAERRRLEKEEADRKMLEQQEVNRKNIEAAEVRMRMQMLAREREVEELRRQAETAQLAEAERHRQEQERLELLKRERERVKLEQEQAELIRMRQHRENVARLEQEHAEAMRRLEEQRRQQQHNGGGGGCIIQ